MIMNIAKIDLPIIRNTSRNTYFFIKKIILLVLILTTCCTQSMAQDPIFSQFYAAPLQLNPAFAGTSHYPSVHLNYRNQWTALPVAYETYAVSYDQFIDQFNSGFGINMMTDDAGNGLLKTTRVTGIFAYRVKVNRDFSLKLGVEAGAIQTRLDWDQLIFYDQLDEIEGFVGGGLPTDEVRPDVLSRTFFDMSAGLLAYSKKFYGGITLKHINTPDDTYLDVNNNLHAGWPLRMTIHGGMEISLQKDNKRGTTAFISPNIMYIQQRDFAQINVGAYLSLSPVFVGAWYRQTFSNSDALIALIGVQKGIFKMGYSYDVTVSSLGNSTTAGSHEISIGFNFGANRAGKIDHNDCFNMFR